VRNHPFTPIRSDERGSRKFLQPPLFTPGSSPSSITYLHGFTDTIYTQTPLSTHPLPLCLLPYFQSSVYFTMLDHANKLEFSFPIRPRADVEPEISDTCVGSKTEDNVELNPSPSKTMSPIGRGMNIEPLPYPGLSLQPRTDSEQGPVTTHKMSTSRQILLGGVMQMTYFLAVSYQHWRWREPY